MTSSGKDAVNFRPSFGNDLDPNTDLLANRIGYVELFADMGLRVMQLTYNTQNSLGSSCYEPVDTRLSRFGREVVLDMGRAGILVDLSHVGDKTSLDTIEASERPVAITHANARSLFDHKRNKTDDVLKALAQTGGVLGCATYRNITGDVYCASAAAWGEMVARTVDLMGIDHVAIGTDRSHDHGTEDYLWMRKGRWTRTGGYGAGKTTAPVKVSPPDFFRETEEIGALEAGLRAVGFSDEEVAKITHGNWLRLYEAVWPAPTAPQREAGDLSAGVYDAQGRMIAQAVTGTPGHVNSMAKSVGHVLNRFPSQQMRPGDVFATNDPWMGTGHLNDMVVVTPAFLGDRLIGFFACTLHVVDIGGAGGGASRQVFEEGLRLPIVRLARGGEIEETVLDILRINVREPVQVIGDVYSEVAANDVGCRRLVEMMGEFGLESLDDLAGYILERSREASLERIRALPRGTWHYEMPIDGIDAPITLKARLTMSEEGIDVDYYDVPDLVPLGYNVPYCYSEAYSCYGIRCVVGPEELTETYAPVVIRRKELRTDSGGAGARMGGLGQVMEITSTEEVPIAVVTSFDRIDHPARGFAGGGPGAPGRLSLASGERLPGKGYHQIEPGQRLVVEMPGGGGYHDPLHRDPAAVAADVLNELVSPDQARALYGVALGPAGAADLVATAALRRGRAS